MMLVHCVMMSQGKRRVLGKCACIIHPLFLTQAVRQHTECLCCSAATLKGLWSRLSTQRHEGEGCVLVCVSVYKSCIGAVSACTLGQMSVSRVHLLKQTAVALHMWPPFISVALEAVRVLTHCVSELPIFTQPQTTYILAKHTNALAGVHTHF